MFRYLKHRFEMKDTKEIEFEQMLSEYGGIIARLCSFYADSKEEAADMRQDTLLNLWRNWDSFKGDSKLTTWVHRVCLNTCVSFIRREHTPLRKSSGSEIPDRPELSEGKDELIREMNGLIKRLKTRERALILLWLEDFSYDDIADVMGLNRNTVATLLRRIKQKLADMKEKDDM